MPGRAQYYCCGQQHINIPHGRSALLLLRKPLSFKTALRLLVPTGLPRKIIPPEFAALVHKPLPPSSGPHRVRRNPRLPGTRRTAEAEGAPEGEEGRVVPREDAKPPRKAPREGDARHQLQENIRRNTPPQGVLENSRASLEPTRPPEVRQTHGGSPPDTEGNVPAAHQLRRYKGARNRGRDRHEGFQ